MVRAILIIVFCLIGSEGFGQQAKEIRTVMGKAVAVVNLVSVRPDCSLGAVSIPTFPQAPSHGQMQMIVSTVDLNATANCPARKIPAIVLVYVPGQDFIGIDTIHIDIADGNRSTTLSYQIKVGQVGDQL